jgi:Holliday junction DNA helicase RuvA
VQSVGPKVALAVLSGGAPRDLMAALAAGDAARFQAVPGIGKRTAERIIVELREKVAGIAVGLPDAAGGAGGVEDPRMLARDGLVELGFPLPEAEALLADAPDGTAEELLAHALRSARR